jgi:putative ABC transport system ATP-binding protein
MKVVEICNVSKTYSSNKKVTVEALKNVNISVDKGEFVAVVGPSGSGKSTLLHLLGGLEKQTQGVIKINGKELDAMKEDELAEYRRKKVGFVFQKFNLIPMLNAKENIELPLLIGNEKVDEVYLEELIRFLGLEDRTKHMPGELSGGQQQRVSIARALVTKPSIILADEPTGNLDQKASEEIVTYLKKLSQIFEQTVIMITHNMDLAKKADRIIRIVDGYASSEKVN